MHHLKDKAAPRLEPGKAAQEMTNTEIVAAGREAGNSTAQLKAALELRGHVVHETGDGGFLVCKWGLAKHCPDARALAGFARQLLGAIT